MGGAAYLHSDTYSPDRISVKSFGKGREGGYYLSVVRSPGEWRRIKACLLVGDTSGLECNGFQYH